MENTVFVLIEDSLEDAQFVQMAFNNVPSHMRLLHIGDAWEAVAYLKGEGQYANRQKYPLPDVILLDLKMPGFDGFDFLRWLRTDAPDGQKRLPVIVMSSSDLKDDVDKAYSLGISAYITKPIDFGIFKERLKLLGVFWSEHAETPQISDTEHH